MAAADRGADQQFENELRHALAARVRDAPLPADLIEVPARWTKGPSAIPMSTILGLAGTAAAAAVLVVVVLSLPALRSAVRAPLSAESAAALIGVPVEQVAESRDGFVAFEVTRVRNPVMLVYLVRDTPEPEAELLVRMPVARSIFDDSNATTWGHWFSCSPARGLDQPNFVVGGGDPPPTYVAVTHTSATVRNGPFFLSVLESSDVTEPVKAEMGNGSFTTPPDAFDQADACTGELIEEH